jgi:hypothetical protein
MALSWPPQRRDCGSGFWVAVTHHRSGLGVLDAVGDAVAYQGFVVLNDFTRVKSWVRGLASLLPNGRSSKHG